MACQDFQLALKQAFESFLNKEGDRVPGQQILCWDRENEGYEDVEDQSHRSSDGSNFQLQGHQEAALFWEEGFVRTLPTFLKNKTVDFVVPAW